MGRSFHSLKRYSRALAAFNDYLRLRPKSSQGCFFMGRAYLALSMPHRAVPFLRKALDIQPENVHFMALLATAYLKSRHSREAADLFREAVEEGARAGLGEKESRRVYRAYLNALLVRGVRLCRDNDYELGVQMLRFVLENGRDQGVDGPFLRLELGRASRETGNFQEALKHYTRALQFAPNDRRIRWSRASILMSLGKNAEAREEIESIRSREPGVPELPWNSALVDIFLIRSFMEAREWRRAAELCRNRLKQEDTNTLFSGGKGMIHVLYAEALRNLRDFGSAHNHLRRALEENPGDLDLWYADILVSWEGKDWKALRKALRMAQNLGGDGDIINRFLILLEVKTSFDHRKNLEALGKAIRALGPEPELMHALGETYLSLGFPEQARSWFQKTISLKENHEEARLGEIAALEVLIAEGRALTDELDKGYRGYLERWPDNVTLRRERALFLIRIFEYPEAAAELEKLLIREPSNPSLRRLLAYAYRKTGRYREAAVFLKALLKEKPHNLELLLEYSGCLARAGGTGYALAVLEKAREVFKDSPDLALAQGILNFRAKKTGAALDYLREAAALSRYDPRPYEWMAAIARKNGDADDARYYEEEAKRRKRTVAES